ncbi:hypothetical protein MK280_14430, partial [Myxococcota bacterium]|nr:hypothetical protein [Myxococcota bacterium]
MSQRPPDVRITDFDVPEFSPEVLQMIEGVAPLAAAIPWTLEAAMEEAREKVGLNDFGEDIFSEPLSIFM